MSVTQHDTFTTWKETGTVPLRGTLVVLPGRGESPVVYERFGRRLASDAYRVHVGSAPSDSPDLSIEQLHGVLGEADPATPRIVVGSDGGAAFAAHLAAHSQLAGANALVLAGLPVAGSAAPGGWESELDARTACGTHRSRISQGGVRPADLYEPLPQEWLDPLIPAAIDLPVLGIHGRDDSISSVHAARRFYAEVPRAELVTIAGGRHDALNDATHRTVAATVVLFLERLRAGTALEPIANTELLHA